MIPGVDPRQLKAMMRQMGMSQVDIEATEVLIKTADGQIYVFENPSVQKVTMQGQTTFQIAGSYKIEQEEVKVEFSLEDIQMVAEQAEVSEEAAKSALEKSGGDIAAAIISLTE